LVKKTVRLVRNPKVDESAIDLWSEPDESSSHPHTIFNVPYNSIHPSTPRSRKWSLPFRLSG